MLPPEGPLEIEPTKQKLLPFVERDVKMRCVVSLHYTFEYSWMYSGKVLARVTSTRSVRQSLCGCGM